MRAELEPPSPHHRPEEMARAPSRAHSPGHPLWAPRQPSNAPWRTGKLAVVFFSNHSKTGPESLKHILAYRGRRLPPNSPDSYGHSSHFCILEYSSLRISEAPRALVFCPLESLKYKFDSPSPFQPIAQEDQSAPSGCGLHRTGDASDADDSPTG